MPLVKARKSRLGWITSFDMDLWCSWLGTNFDTVFDLVGLDYEF